MLTKQGIDVKIMNGRDEVIEQLRSGPIFNSAFGLKWRIADLPGGIFDWIGAIALTHN